MPDDEPPPPSPNVSLHSHFDRELSSLTRKRATHKSRITFALNKIDVHNKDRLQISLEVIEENLNKIQAIDEQISSLYSSDETRFDNVHAELESQTEYRLNVSVKISQLRGMLQVPAIAPPIPSHENQNSHANFDLKLPVLSCGTFSGEGSNSNEFHTFITSFNNIIGNRTNINNSTKLTYLKTYLRGYALKIIQHLQINDGKYRIKGILTLDITPKTVIFHI